MSVMSDPSKCQNNLTMQLSQFSTYKLSPAARKN